jgi:hypothetical protein
MEHESAFHFVALQQLVAEYFAELDTTFGVNSPQFFTEDGVVDIGHMSFQGHAAMREFYEELARQVATQDPTGMRTTRHAYTNFRVSFESDASAIVDLLVIEFSGSGPPPLLDASAPTIVSDARLRCRLESDGRWRIFELTGRPVFAGNDPVLNRLLVG